MGSETIYGDAIQDIKKRMEEEEYRKGFEKGKIEKVDIVSPYIDRMKEEFSFSDPPAIALDTGNGTAGPLMSDLFEELGIQFKGLYIEPDGDTLREQGRPTVLGNALDADWSSIF